MQGDKRVLWIASLRSDDGLPALRFAPDFVFARTATFAFADLKYETKGKV
jgi:hypothetical protein